MLIAPVRNLRMSTTLPPSKDGEDPDVFTEDEEDKIRLEKEKEWAAARPTQSSIVPAALCCAFHPIHPWIFGGFDDGIVRLYV